MQHLEVSGAVQPLKWPLGVKWLSIKYTLFKNIHYIFVATKKLLNRIGTEWYYHY